MRIFHFIFGFISKKIFLFSHIVWYTRCCCLLVCLHTSDEMCWHWFIGLWGVIINAVSFWPMTAGAAVSVEMAGLRLNEGSSL